MKYRVTVRQADDEEKKRVVDAPSRFAVYAQIEKEGSTVISLKEGSGIVMPAWLNMTIGTGVSQDELLLLIKNLSAMLNAGLTLSRSLTIVERQTRNKQLKKVVGDISKSIKKGSPFHKSLAEHPKLFSKLFIAMAHAGEEGGALAESLSIVGLQMERSRNLTKKIHGAMIYPAIIIFAMIVIAILMLVFVVPTLTSTFTQLGVKLPIATQVIVATSNFLINHTILMVFATLSVIAAVLMFVRSQFGSQLMSDLILRTPVIGELVQETYAARAARTLASLLSSGVDMLNAIQITREVVSTKAFADVLKEAEQSVRKGEPLSKAFAAHPKQYPVMFSDMIEVGEETGKVAGMLKQVADFYEGDVEQKTKDLSTIIEPVLMLLIGTGVGIFAVAIISPIYSLSSAM